MASLTRKSIKEIVMNRSEMVCRSCIKFDETCCRLGPDPILINDPDKHWCSQGIWHQWSERFQEMEPFYWGEWEDRSAA